MKRQVKIGLLGISLLGLFMVLLLGNNLNLKSTSEPVIKNTYSTPIKAVIFDLGNVLIKTSTPKLLWELGPADILKYCIVEQTTPFSLIDKVHEVVRFWGIETGCPDQEGKVATYEGTPLPKPMQEWQKGHITSQELYEQAEAFMQAHDKKNPCGFYQKKLITKCVQILAQPDSQMKTKERKSDIIEIVKKIRSQHDEFGNRKFKLIILSNMEKELVPYIKQQFNDVISLFDDHIFSGEINMIKPHKEIYDHTIEKHGLKHHECFFIDDLEENIQAATEYSWQTFHLHKKSTADQLHAALQHHGILAI